MVLERLILFTHFCSSLNPRKVCDPPSPHRWFAAPLCPRLHTSHVPRYMASDDNTMHAAEAAKLNQKLKAVVATVETMKKKADATHARVLTGAALLEEEQRTTTTLEIVGL
jgi:hypothetical protein